MILQHHNENFSMVIIYLSECTLSQRFTLRKEFELTKDYTKIFCGHSVICLVSDRPILDFRWRHFLLCWHNCSDLRVRTYTQVICKKWYYFLLLISVVLWAYDKRMSGLNPNFLRSILHLWRTVCYVNIMGSMALWFLWILMIFPFICSLRCVVLVFLRMLFVSMVVL